MAREDEALVTTVASVSEEEEGESLRRKMMRRADLRRTDWGDDSWALDNQNLNRTQAGWVWEYSWVAGEDSTLAVTVASVGGG